MRSVLLLLFLTGCGADTSAPRDFGTVDQAGDLELAPDLAGAPQDLAGRDLAQLGDLAQPSPDLAPCGQTGGTCCAPASCSPGTPNLGQCAGTCVDYNDCRKQPATGDAVCFLCGLKGQPCCVGKAYQCAVGSSCSSGFCQ